MGQIAYYLRTSHYLQNIGTQIDKIEPEWKIYKDEGISGRILFQDRQSGRKLIEDLGKGKIDEVVVLRIDRLGRDTTDILNTIKAIHSYGVGIRSLNEGLSTLVEGKETPMSNLLINLLSSLSEFQYHQLREKTLDGVQRAKLGGKYRGRLVGSVEPMDKFFAKPKVSKIKLMLDQGMSIRNICAVVECSPNYIYKVKDRLLSA
ncbi:MAG TPA: recombinase family protein [Clostridia bacterium]|nr:recombinase family protein [Clostridia bacterium]